MTSFAIPHTILSHFPEDGPTNHDIVSLIYVYYRINRFKGMLKTSFTIRYLQMTHVQLTLGNTTVPQVIHIDGNINGEVQNIF